MTFLLPLLSLSALAEPTELTLWHAYRGEERAALEGLLEEYDEAHPDILVVPLALPYESFFTKLESAAPRGNGPDLFIAAHERVGSWAESGLVAPVDIEADLFHPATVEALHYDGAQYGLPMSFKCLALYYNRALLDAPPADTDALVALARTMRGPDQFALAYQATEPYVHAPWMYGFGGGVFDGDAVALDAPGNADALSFILSMYDEGLLPEEPTGALITQLFNQGQAAMVISGPWFLGELEDGLDFAVAPLPIVSATGLPASPFLTVEGVLVSAHAEHPEAARELSAWLVGTQPAIERAVIGRQSVATLAAYADPRISGDPILAAFRDQLDDATPLPNRPEMAATWEPMARALRRVTRGALLPEDAVRTAQQEYEIVSRPPPEPANPTPYIIIFSLLALAGVSWVGLQAYRHRKEMRKQWHAYAYVAPSALAMTILVVVPFVVGSVVSLFTHHNGEFTFVGLANFLDILLARDWSVTSPLSFYFTLVVTLLWTAVNVVLHVSIGLFLALLLREPWLQLRGVYRVLLILPWAVPNYITALIWKGMFHRQFGAINSLLEAVGLEPVSWFSQFSTAFAANVITNTWLGFPFMMVVTLGALQSIPRELDQAASVDGATGWQRLWYITLPQLRPALMPAVILGSVWTFNMFNIIFLVSGGEPDGGTDILISEAYRWAFTRGHRYGYASAYAVLIFFVLLGYSRMGNKIAGQKVL
ncbi:MAG: arabinogalactan oligomer/maltooligosaccharide transport system permease protein [Myxococcota bacterium]|jgi:arabinogalactan oligomer/maltooligosaccharide transport system permease protein